MLMNYYANEVDGDALIQLAYEGLGGYLNRLPLSYKKKAAVLDAFNDIVNRGIIGFDKGLLMIQNSEGLDMSQYKGFNPYEEAAYYLEGVFKSTSNKPKEPEKPKDKFTNKEMLLDFTNHMSKSRFGGATNLQSQWDELDALDENGIRGTLNRKTELINLLENWNPKFDNVDFTDSAFTDSNDFHARRQAAIDALKASEGISPQAVEALLRLGLNPGTLFRTGADEMVTYGDKQMTRLQAVEAMAKEKQAAEEQKLAAERVKEETALKALREVTKSGKYADYKPTKVSSLEELGAKYGSEEAFVKHILELQLKKDWTVDDVAEIIGYYKAKGGREMNDDERLHYLDNQYSIGFDKDRFERLKSTINGWKAIDGIQGLYYNPSTNRLRRFVSNEFGTTAGSDLLALYNIQSQQKEYLNKELKDFGSLEYLEVGSYIADIIAAIDPEPVSSTALSQAAAGARDVVRKSDPEGFTLGDWGWATVDHTTGLASLFPFVGDAIKGIWAGFKLSNDAVKVGKIFLRAANSYALAHGSINSYNSLKEKYDKYGFKEMWKHINKEDLLFASEIAMGMLGHTQMNRNNLAAKRTLNESGVETTRTFGGFFKPKVKETTPTINLKAGDKKIEVPITEQLKNEFSNNLKKAGNNAEARLKALNNNSNFKESLANAKDANGNPVKLTYNDKGELVLGDVKVELVYTPTWRNARAGMFSFPFIKSEGNSFGTSVKNQGLDRFKEFLETVPTIRGKKRYLAYRKQFEEEGIIKPGNNRTSTENTSGGSSGGGSGTPTPKTEVRNSENKYLDVNSNKRTRNFDTSKDFRGKYLMDDGSEFEIVFNKSTGEAELIHTKESSSPIKLGTDVTKYKELITKYIKDYNTKIRGTTVRRKVSLSYLNGLKDLRKKGLVYKHGGSFNYFSKYDY